jgi:hypothetical protein
MRSDLIGDLPQSRGVFVNTAAAMLAVGVLATASMAYALQSTGVAPSWAAALVAGACWGVIVVTIDRMLVTSMGRHPSGGWRNFLGATASFALRLAMALVIGAVVSMPLVLKIYEPEIAAQVQADIADRRVEARLKLDADFARVADLEGREADLQSELEKLTFYDPAEINPAYAEALAARDSAVSACAAADAAAAAEAAGAAGTGRSGYGDEWARLSAVARDKCAAASHAEQVFGEIASATEREYQETTAAARQRTEGELARVGGELTGLRAERAEAEAKLNGAVNASGGLAARVQGLDNLARSQPGVWWARFALMAVLMLVEAMPVFSKYIRVLSAADLPSVIEQRRDQARVADEDALQAARVGAVAIRAGVQGPSARDWAAKQLMVDRLVNTRAAALDKEVRLRRLEDWARAERAKSAPGAGASGGQAGGSVQTESAAGRSPWSAPVERRLGIVRR